MTFKKQSAVVDEIRLRELAEEDQYSTNREQAKEIDVTAMSTYQSHYTLHKPDIQVQLLGAP